MYGLDLITVLFVLFKFSYPLLHLFHVLCLLTYGYLIALVYKDGDVSLQLYLREADNSYGLPRRHQ